MSSSQTNTSQSADVLIFFLHFGFLVSGIITVLIGQILPVLSSRLSLDDKESGYFFIAQFAGSVFGTLLTHFVAKHFGFGKATVLGCLAMTAGILFLNSDIWSVCLAAFFTMGFGIGTTLPSINMLVAELNPLKTTSALNFLNFFWGIGAIICKPFVDFFGTPNSIFQPTLILAILLFIISVAIALAPFENKTPFESHRNESRETVLIWTTLPALLIALFNFIHVGFESGAGGWITTYTNRLHPTETFWFSPTLAYFLFFVLGRGIAPLYLRLMKENKMLWMNLLILTFGVFVLVTGKSFWILILGASIAGFGTSSIFPTNMARFTKTFGSTATRRATPLFISGTLGSALITQLIGYVSTGYNDLRTGMFVLLASCLALIVLQIFLTLNPKIKF